MAWLLLGFLVLFGLWLLRGRLIHKNELVQQQHGERALPNPRPVLRWRSGLIRLGIFLGLFLWWILWGSLISGSHVGKLPVTALMVSPESCRIAAAALETHLIELGYAATEERPNGKYSSSPPPIYERWYQPSDHSPIWVTVYYWRDGQLDIRVEWDTIGLRLNKKRINAEGEAIEEDLQKWWKKYKASHPGHEQ